MRLKVKLHKTIGEYIVLETFIDDAIKILNILSQNLGREGEDVRDTIRMIKHFDDFYNLMKKKFKEYLTPRKDMSDILRKRVLIDKLKLIKRDNTKVVELILDRSITMDQVLAILINNNIEVELS